MKPEGLAALERRLAHDLVCLNYPPANWVKPHSHGNAARVLDVAFVGAGTCGIAASFALLREGIGNIALFDRNPAGQEGPWVTYARMATLRSPKHLAGPVMGLPSLTFRQWYEAQHGMDAWETLGKIPRAMWMEYLRWYRKVLNLPVENGVTIERLAPEGGLIRLDLTRGGKPSTEYARKVVFATGREGLGGPAILPAFASLPPSHLAHTMDAIDFAVLKGKRVAVIGAGASAFDNAVTALDAGAASIAMFVRRDDLPRYNRFKQIVYGGFMNGFAVSDDAWRWHSLYQVMNDRVAAPRESVMKVTTRPNYTLHLGSPVTAARMVGGEVELTTPKGARRADFVILGTGFAVDPHLRPELAGFANEIALWRDRFTPPADEPLAELGGFPYLGPGFEFTEKHPGRAPFLANIHCFNYAATMSQGPVAGDIPGVEIGALRMAQAIARSFYREDRALHSRDLDAYAEKELLGDEWPGLPRS